KGERDQLKVQEALDRLRKAAEKTNENLFLYVLEAVKAKATVGEISKVLRDIWGEWRGPTII
ncbi:MAG: methylmalonyl-CoA mutase family protein, partial [Candidatus Methanomethylicia archaeon]